jgi:hypothetical protein
MLKLTNLNTEYIGSTLPLPVVLVGALFELGVIFDSSGATAAQAATVEHESDRP